MKKRLMTVFPVIFLFAISVVLSFTLYNMKKSFDLLEKQAGDTPTTDEAWAQVTTTNEWIKGKSALLFQEETMPYTYRLRTNDFRFGCYVIPYYKNERIAGLLFGTLVFEKDTGFVAEGGLEYTSLIIGSVGEILQGPASTTRQRAFDNTCGKYVPELPLEIAKYLE